MNFYLLLIVVLLSVLKSMLVGGGRVRGSYTVLGQFTYPFPNFPHVKWLLNGFFAQQTSLPSVTGFDLFSECNFWQLVLIEIATNTSKKSSHNMLFYWVQSCWNKWWGSFFIFCNFYLSLFLSSGHKVRYGRLCKNFSCSSRISC